MLPSGSTVGNIQPRMTHTDKALANLKPVWDPLYLCMEHSPLSRFPWRLSAHSAFPSTQKMYFINVSKVTMNQEDYTNYKVEEKINKKVPEKMTLRHLPPLLYHITSQRTSSKPVHAPYQQHP